LSSLDVDELESRQSYSFQINYFKATFIFTKTK
jgi:hypothetical protein